MLTRPVGVVRRSRVAAVTTLPRPALGALLVVVASVDLVLALVAVPRPMFGLLDEVGHLSTTWLLLAAWAALTRRPWRPVVLGGALVATVLVDLDHVPLELFGNDVLMRGLSRPVSHSLLTVFVLLVAGVVLPGRVGRAVGGAGIGVLLHLWRDLATAPVPLLWPLTHEVALGRVPVWSSLVVAVAVLLLPGRRPLVSGRP